MATIPDTKKLCNDSLGCHRKMFWFVSSQNFVDVFHLLKIFTKFQIHICGLSNSKLFNLFLFIDNGNICTSENENALKRVFLHFI